MSVLDIKNLTFSYPNKKIFNKLNLSINKGSHITILGPIGSGKTTLVNLINEKHKSIKISGNYYIIYSNPLNQIVGKTVREQLLFHMELNNYSSRKISNRIKKIVNYFDIESILDVDPFRLSVGIQQLIVIASYLVLDSDIFIFDNSFNLLDETNRKKVFDYLKKLKKITIICFSSNPEDVLMGEEMAIMNQKIVFKSILKTAFDNDKIYLSNNLNLPFMADLSLKLQYYEIIDKIILDKNDLVNEIWK